MKRPNKNSPVNAKPAAAGQLNDESIDRRMQRLRNDIKGADPGSLARAKGSIELAGIYSDNLQSREARNLLAEAEQILERHSADPSGTMLAEALAATISGQGDAAGNSMLVALELRVLYRAYYEVCAKVYPLKAAYYRELAAKRDSRELNDAFSQAMSAKLPGLLGLK
jgi:hypothetical protein